MPTMMTNSTNNTMLPDDIAMAINMSFGNFSAFKKNMTETGLGVFGSGWAWLTYNPSTKMLAVEPTANQDNPISKGLGYSGNIPLLVGIPSFIYPHVSLKGHTQMGGVGRNENQ